MIDPNAIRYLRREGMSVWKIAETLGVTWIEARDALYPLPRGSVLSTEALEPDEDLCRCRSCGIEITEGRSICVACSRERVA